MNLMLEYFQSEAFGVEDATKFLRRRGWGGLYTAALMA
jgi:hypothetical protein